MAKGLYQSWHEQDFRRDTLHLSTDARLVYRELLQIMWDMPGCLMPVHDPEIARLLRMPVKRWKRLRPEIEPMFSVVERTQDRRLSAKWVSFWASKRQLIERRKVDDLSADRSSAGKLGAEAKRLKSLEQAQATASAKPQATNQANGQANDKPPTPTPTREEGGGGGDARAREPRPEPGRAEADPAAVTTTRAPPHGVAPEHLAHVRASAGIAPPPGCPPAWHDDALGQAVAAWRDRWGLPLAEIVAVAGATRGQMREPMRSPAGLRPAMERHAAARQHAADVTTITPSTGGTDARALAGRETAWDRRRRETQRAHDAEHAEAERLARVYGGGAVDAD